MTLMGSRWKRYVGFGPGRNGGFAIGRTRMLVIEVSYVMMVGSRRK